MKRVGIYPVGRVVVFAIFKCVKVSLQIMEIFWIT